MDDSDIPELPDACFAALLLLRLKVHHFDYTIGKADLFQNAFVRIQGVLLARQ